MLEFDPGSGFVHALALVALIVILFRDGLEVEAEMLQRAWRLPLRKLVLAMPVTAVIVALAAHAAHRPRLGASASCSARCSRRPTRCCRRASSPTRGCRASVRHSLNLESGLNDGLALPAVLAFIAALRVGEDDFVWWRFVLQDVDARLRLRRRDRATRSVAAAARRGTAVDPRPSEVALRARRRVRGLRRRRRCRRQGNGLIAVFVCAIVLGIRRPDLRATFEHLSEDIVEIVKLGVFVVFGSLLTLDGLFGDGLAAVAIVAVTLLVARPVAICVALAGTGLPAS